MTAPLFFLPDGGLDAGVVGQVLILDGDEGRHAAMVRRLAVGAAVLLADGSGRLAHAQVVAAATSELSLRLVRLVEAAVPEPRFVLVQALAKGDRDEQAIEAATELGVDEVVPWQAARSIVIWRGDRGERARTRWQSLVRAASKQSRRPTVPVVGGLAHHGDVVSRITSASLALVLHEDAASPLAGIEQPASGEVLVVVGPEGGISPAELQAFVDAGAQAVRLGETVLRSSSAGPAALAVLSADSRWR